MIWVLWYVVEQVLMEIRYCGVDFILYWSILLILEYNRVIGYVYYGKVSSPYSSVIL